MWLAFFRDPGLMGKYGSLDDNYGVVDVVGFACALLFVFVNLGMIAAFLRGNTAILSGGVQYRWNVQPLAGGDAFVYFSAGCVFYISLPVLVHICLDNVPYFSGLLRCRPQYAPLPLLHAFACSLVFWRQESREPVLWWSK